MRSIVDNAPKTKDTPDLTRRRMLMRLGLAATAIYVAPTLTHLAGAKASSASGGSSSGPSGSGRRGRRSARAGGGPSDSCSLRGGSGRRCGPVRRIFGSGPS